MHWHIAEYEEEEDSEEESGKDWDELEEEARKGVESRLALGGACACFTPCVLSLLPADREDAQLGVEEDTSSHRKRKPKRPLKNASPAKRMKRKR